MGLMADPKTSNTPLRSLDTYRKDGILTTLNNALDDHATFNSVMVCAFVKSDDGHYFVRVYSSNMNRLERLGLLLESEDALLHD